MAISQLDLLPSGSDIVGDIFGSELDISLDVPDILTFVTHRDLLNRPNLYPRQGTLLKILFLEKENLTTYDLRVIKEWEDRYLETADEKGEGFEGIVPGVLERIDLLRICPCGHDRALHHMGEAIGPWGRRVSSPCGGKDCICPKYRGRRWFREFISVIGRRGSKGHFGALAVAYILWTYIQMGDPHRIFGLDPDKRLSCIVFGGKKEQAKANQWRDINNVILGAPCFSEFVSRPLGESITINTKMDKRHLMERSLAGTRIEQQDRATFEIIPKESTQIAARGPASFCLIFDEAAHVVKGVSNIPAEDVYESSTPSLDQFGNEAFIYIPSSPWQRIGLFYDKYLEAIEVDEEGEPVYPEKLMIQLPSWVLYEDWEIAHTIEMRPGGPNFDQLHNAIQVYDHQLQQLERSNPETFRVERRARFANILDAYLNEARVAEIWQPWPSDGDSLKVQSQGKLQVVYRAHGDPSKSGARFGFAIAHKEKPDPESFSHVIFDVIHHWDPQDFDEGEIGYGEVEAEIKDFLDAFQPKELTFDQFNSVGTIQNLRRYIKKRNYPKRTSIYERTATGPLNWKTYETFKTALGLRLVHAPYYEIANQELLFLQDLGGKVDAPTAGPVQTKDVADCYHPDMEILTATGWRSIVEVQEGEVVATRSQSGELEYQAVTDRIERWHDGDLYEYEGRDISFSVTPTHNMLVYERRAGGSSYLVHANSLPRYSWVPRTASVGDRLDEMVSVDHVDRSKAMERQVGRGGWNRRWSADEDDYLTVHYASESMVDLCVVLNRRRDSIYSRAKKLGLRRGQVGDRVGDWPEPLPKVSREDFARFIGIWLSEGSFGGGYSVRISQKRREGVEWIDDLLERMGWPAVRNETDRRVTWRIKSQGLREYLRGCVDGDGLSIPDEVFTSWSRMEMEALLEGLCMGDGTRDPKGRHSYIGYSSSSKRLVDDVQRLLAHIGLVGNVRLASDRVVSVWGGPAKPMWSVNINVPLKANGARLIRDRIRRIPYSGTVHCVTVPNHTLLVRRRGVPMWAGNCMAIITYELIGDEIAEFIGQSLSELTMRASQPGGFDPYDKQREDPHDKLSKLSRSGTRSGTDPARGAMRKGR